MKFSMILICSVGYTQRSKLPEYNLTDRMWPFTKIEVKARPEFLINCQHNKYNLVWLFICYLSEFEVIRIVSWLLLTCVFRYLMSNNLMFVHLTLQLVVVWSLMLYFPLLCRGISMAIRERTSKYFQMTVFLLSILLIYDHGWIFCHRRLEWHLSSQRMTHLSWH